MACKHRYLPTTPRGWVLLLLLLAAVPLLLRWRECRFTEPRIHVHAVLYRQATNTFEVETKRNPWWSLRTPPNRVRLETMINEQRVAGLIPAPEFRPWDVVDPPDQDQIWPGYTRDEHLPEGKWYAPPTPWRCPSQLVYEDGEWRLGLMRVHLRPADPDAPVELIQFDPRPPHDGGVWGYAFHTHEMGGIMSRGLGQSFTPSTSERIQGFVALLPFIPD
jgi:hypothetical protein